jgi:hypothetical protein
MAEPVSEAADEEPTVGLPFRRREYSLGVMKDLYSRTSQATTRNGSCNSKNGHPTDKKYATWRIGRLLLVL